MGSSLSSNVDFKLPIKRVCTKSEHHYQYHCGPKLTTQSSPGKLNVQSLHSNDKLATKTPAAIPAAYVVPSEPSVLIVSEVESDDSLPSDSTELEKDSRCQLEGSLRNFNKELEDPQASLESFSDQNQIRKEEQTIYNFIKAWKAGLSGYPHERIEKVCSDIPLAATAQCKQGISRCRRCHRLCIQCTSAEQSEHLLDDLLHKESLDRFQYETEFQQIASSIVIRQNLKRKQLYESVAHPNEDQGEVSEGEEIAPCEEDLTISFRFNLPPPVHLEHPVQDDLIHLPPPEVIHKKYDQHHQKEADLLEHEMLDKAHHTQGHHHHFHLNEIVEKVEKLIHLDHHPAPEILTGRVASKKSVKKNLHFNLDGITDKESNDHPQQDQNHDDQHHDQNHPHKNNEQHDNKNEDEHKK